MFPPLAETGESGGGYEDIGVFLHSGIPGKSAISFLNIGRDPHIARTLGGFRHRVAIWLMVTPSPPVLDKWDMELPSIGKGNAAIRA